MMSTDNEFFQIGGALSADAPSYIERPADVELLNIVARGEYCLVLAPRQTGKSSLMVHTIARLEERGALGAVVDLQPLGKQANRDIWFNAVISQIGRQLRLRKETDAWLAAVNQPEATQRFMLFFEDVVLTKLSGNVAIFVDEIDSALGLLFSDDFFTTLRSLYNARAMNPELRRLVFVLLGVTTPSALVKDRSRTPYNIGRQISLGDFDANTKQSLESFRRVLGDGSEALIERIFYWTSGQPYLVQKLASAGYSWPPAERTVARLDQEVQDTYLRAIIDQDTHFQFIERYIVDDLSLLRPMLEVYRQVLVGAGVEHEPQSPLQTRLKMAGLVAADDGRLVSRNRIYRHLFDEGWIEKQEQRAFSTQGRLAAAAEEWARRSYDESFLYRGEQLKEVATWLAQPDVRLTPQMRQFVQASSSLEDKERLAAAVRDRAAAEQARALEEQRREVAEQLAAEADRRRELEEGRAREKAETAARLLKQRRTLVAVSCIALVLALAAGYSATQARASADLAEKRGQEALASAEMAEHSGKEAIANAGLAERRRVEAETEAHAAIEARNLAEQNQAAAQAARAEAQREAAKARAAETAARAGERRARFAEEKASQERDRSNRLNNDLKAKQSELEKAIKENTALNVELVKSNAALRELTDATMAKANQARNSLRSTDRNTTGFAGIIRGHGAVVTNAGFSPDGSELVTAGADDTVRVWRWEPGKKYEYEDPVALAEVKVSNPVHVDFADGGRTVRVESGDGVTRAFEIPETAGDSPEEPPLKEISSPTGKAPSALSADGWNAVVVNDNTVRLSHDGVAPIEFPPLAEQITRVTVARGGRYVAALTKEGAVYLLDAKEPKKKWKPLRHGDVVTDMEFDKEGERFVTAHLDGVARIWRADGKFVIGLRDRHGLLFKRKVGEHKNIFQKVLPIDADFLSRQDTQMRLTVARFDESGRRVITGADDGQVRIWCVGDPEKSVVLTGHSSVITDARFSPDGKFALTASKDGTARVWALQRVELTTWNQCCNTEPPPNCGSSSGSR